jgi:UDP-glucuronate decarboxylase
MMEKNQNIIIKEDLQYIIDQPLDWNKLEGKTIIVTGANGFLPAYMVETLLFLNDCKFSRPTKVIGLVRDIEKARIRFGIKSQREDFELFQADVNEPFDYELPIHYIIHAASQASPKYFGIDPVGTLLPNTIGTNNLLRLAMKNPIESFLFFSSGEVYGILDSNKIPTKEGDYGFVDPTNVRSCYGESKRMGETMCVSYFYQYNVPIKIIRPFHTYGPGMLLNDGRVFADFVSDIVNEKNIIMKSEGNAIRPFCYISDAIIGFFCVLLNGENGEAYNVGNPHEEISIKKLADTLVSLFPEKKLKVIEVKRSDNYLKSPINRNCPDITKLQKLGWKPKIGIKQGFKKTIQSYKTQ